MDSNLIWLIVVGVLNIAFIVAESAKNKRGHTAFKPLIILSGLAVVWFGFQWQSWLGAIGIYMLVLLLAATIKNTIIRN